MTLHIVAWNVMVKVHSHTGQVPWSKVESGAQEAEQERILERSLLRRLGGASSATKKRDWVWHSGDGVWWVICFHPKSLRTRTSFYKLQCPLRIMTSFFLSVRLKEPVSNDIHPLKTDLPQQVAVKGRPHHVLDKHYWGLIFCSFHIYSFSSGKGTWCQIMQIICY